MQIKSNYKRVQGAVAIYNRMLRLRGMDQEEVAKRLHVIEYAYRYGEKAAAEAFKISVRTIRRWKVLLRESGGNIRNLESKSRKPKNFRKSKFKEQIVDCILALRKEHLKLGAKKIYYLLKKRFREEDVPSIAGIERIIKRLKERGLLPKQEQLSFNAKLGKLFVKTKKRKKKLRRSSGENVFQVDTVIRHFSGIKLYTVTGIDTETRYAFAKCFTTHKSEKTAVFLENCLREFRISKIQTDNGSEFARYFEQVVTSNNLIHYHTYPRSPKMNAFVERFNRTLDEEFLKWNKFLAFSSLEELNLALDKYLDWYNLERPHESLGFLSPQEYMLRLEGEDRCV